MADISRDARLNLPINPADALAALIDRMNTCQCNDDMLCRRCDDLALAIQTIERLQQQIHQHDAQIKHARTRSERLANERNDLRQIALDLRKVATHADGCNGREQQPWDRYTCNCGRDAAAERLRKHL